LSLQQWETYYRGGALSTCPTAPDGGYDQEVREAWVDFFSALPDGARLLDVGTGNGVVPLIAADTAATLGRQWQIHGTDLARIDPVKHVPNGTTRFAGITFHPGVATEKLPFDDALFDAASAHYAFEYADTGAALRELHRVLKPGADAQFIVHHNESALVRAALQSLHEANWLFSEAKIYRRVHKLVTMEGDFGEATRTTAASLRAAIQELKGGIDVARRRGGGRVLMVALDAVQKLLEMRKTVAPAKVGLEVDRAEEAMRDSVRRLKDLVAHARSDADMAAMEDQARVAGFEVVARSPQFHGGNNLVGWRVRLHKA
jgi:ubiquinone/menaquinone biosynthesis C-methylase UbiE